jgi:alkylation response protein AidB-like acyl-CoA dehydrogenase
MYLQFSPEQTQFRQSLREFLDEQAPLGYLRSMYDDNQGTSDKVWKGLSDLGYQGILIPETFGGLGLGLIDMGAALEELGRSLHPGPYFSSSVAATLAVLAMGDDENGDLLASLASGARKATLALMESGGFARWPRPETRAEGRSGAWAVSGEKLHVGDPVAADTVLVYASAPDGPALFSVAREDAAVKLDDPLDRSRKAGTVTFRSAPARRIGSGEHAAMDSVVDRILIALVVDSVGTAQRALEISTTYAKERIQFDKPVGSFQAVQHLCVDMYHAVEVCRLFGYHGLWSAEGDDERECHRAAVMAKAISSEMLPGVGEKAIQVHGGIGITWEHDIGLYYKRCLSMQYLYGGPNQHFDTVADLVLG